MSNNIMYVDKEYFNKEHTQDDVKMFFMSIILRAYINEHTHNYNKQFYTSIDCLTTDCGLRTRNSNKDNQRLMTDLLHDLESDNKISITHIKHQIISIVKREEMYSQYKSFVCLTDDEMYTILNESYIKPYIMIAVLLFIKQYIYIVNGQNKLACVNYVKLKKTLGFSSDKTLKRYIDKLVELQLLFCSDTLYFYKEKDYYYQAPHVFALEEEQLIHVKEELKHRFKTNRLYLFHEVDKTKIKHKRNTSK